MGAQISRIRRQSHSPTGKPVKYNVLMFKDHETPCRGRLAVTNDDIILYHAKSRDTLTTWPIRHIRRYGWEEEAFSFESGRRCPSGEAFYTFESRDARIIFECVQNAVNQIAAAEIAARVVDAANRYSGPVGSNRPVAPNPNDSGRSLVSNPNGSNRPAALNLSGSGRTLALNLNGPTGGTTTPPLASPGAGHQYLNCDSQGRFTGVGMVDGFGSVDTLARAKTPEVLGVEYADLDMDRTLLLLTPPRGSSNSNSTSTSQQQEGGRPLQARLGGESVRGRSSLGDAVAYAQIDPTKSKAAANLGRAES